MVFTRFYKAFKKASKICIFGASSVMLWSALLVSQNQNAVNIMQKDESEEKCSSALVPLRVRGPSAHPRFQATSLTHILSHFGSKKHFVQSLYLVARDTRSKLATMASDDEFYVRYYVGHSSALFQNYKITDQRGGRTKSAGRFAFHLLLTEVHVLVTDCNPFEPCRSQTYSCLDNVYPHSNQFWN